jgi:hypothetical protein
MTYGIAIVCVFALTMTMYVYLNDIDFFPKG